MEIRGKEILIPTSMVGNYPNPRWWDASLAAISGDQEPPDSISREALEDAIGAIALDQENAGSISSRTAECMATTMPNSGLLLLRASAMT